jgi:molybdate transport system substrate-binding protein
VRRPLALLAGLLLLAACGGSGPAAATRTLTVFAASSLTDVFAQEATAFEAAHPTVHVRFSYAGSQSLVAQLQQGAPADVLATADLTAMAAAHLPASQVFARNRLALVTAPGNPRHIERLADLARPGVRVVLAGPTVPVGRAARKALTAAHVTVRPVSLEQNVNGVLTKVRLGEADAGIAYVTDLHGVTGLPLPGISNSLAVGVVKDGADARAFVAFLLSPKGQSVLRAAGFLPP